METIEVSKGDPIERIVLLATMKKIHTLVVGLPVRMDGTEGSSAAKVRDFAARLQERLPALPLVLTDETLTTSTAAEKLRAAGHNAKKQKSIIDQAAAVEILNLWMGDSDE